jgi:predicted alpha/beta hydrolase family esterase
MKSALRAHAAGGLGSSGLWCVCCNADGLRTAGAETGGAGTAQRGHHAGNEVVLRTTRGGEEDGGRFFVAPSDSDRPMPPGTVSPLQGFGGMILKRLPYPSEVVAGRNDDRFSFERAQAFAQAWGSMFFDGGINGHLGSASLLGVWPAGLVYFGQFLPTLHIRD